MPVKGCDLAIPEKSVVDYVLGRCSSYGNAVALVDNSNDGKSLTYSEIYEQSQRCGAFLRQDGLKKGDFVGLCAQTSLEYQIAMLGILACGATVTPCNPDFKDGEILQQFSVSEPKAVFVDETTVESMKNMQRQLPFLEKIYVIGRSHDFVTFGTMMNGNIETDCLRTVEINLSEDIAFLPYSSGTTGLPKSVMQTQRNLLTTILVFGEQSMWGKESTCVYMERPMYHVGGYYTVLTALANGIKLVMDRQFNLDWMLKAIERYHVSHMLTAPSILMEIGNSDAAEQYDTSSVQTICYGGAAMPQNIVRRLTEKLHIKIAAVYGMTEVGFSTECKNVEEFPNSVGKTCPSVEIKVIDLTTGRECPVGHDGEILVRGPQLMKEYLKNTEATSQTIDKDGWLHTGDIGHLGEREMLYVVDRLKEIIKYKNFQVSPAELECVIIKHPKVVDVGVIGIPDPAAGEIPKAFIVRKDETLRKEEVDTLVKHHLADYKRPRGGIEFIATIPKSDIGKVKRRELKKMAGIE